MQKVEHDLLSEKHTKVYHEDDDRIKFNAPHDFVVVKSSASFNENLFPEAEDVLTQVSFQKGPIKEYGVNGVNNEDLIIMVIERLEYFQDSEYACRENEIAKTKLEEALLWLRKRTMGREKRGVEGTHTI